MNGGWTKNNAVKYCIQIAELNLINSSNDAKIILEIYQDMLLPNNEELFYSKLWKHAVLPSLKSMATQRYDNPSKAIEFLEKMFMLEDEPEDLEHFISCINNVKSNIDDLENINMLSMCMNEIKNYIIIQLNKINDKNISGPECLMRYVYPYLSILSIPKDDDNSRWIMPSMKTTTYGIKSLKSRKIVPEQCSFCCKGQTFEVFARQCTEYVYVFFSVCKDCVEFKKYYALTCVCGDSITELSITPNNKLDFSNFEKK